MKRSMVGLAVITAFALVAAACGSDGGGGPIESIGEGEGKVVIVAWAGYIERGETDAAYDWVTQFETDTGCQVEVKVAGTSDEMVTLMQGSKEFDLVTASGDASLRLITGGTVQEVNIDLIPNWSTVDSRLQNAPWHTVDGKHYGTPYQWGSNVLAYNTDVFPTPPESWSVVFEEQTLPDGETNKGRVQAYDGPIYIADAALYLKSKDPSLGIQDPYALNQEQFDAAIALLQSQRQLVARYWHDVAVQIDDFTTGGLAASGSWPFQVNMLQFDEQPVSSTIPKEGATGWADTTLLHADAPHPNCAYKWMDWSLTPQVQGDVAAWFGSVPSVPAGCDASELLGAEGCATNGFDDFDRISFWKTPQADCFGQGEECVTYDKWVSEYLKILGSA